MTDLAVPVDTSDADRDINRVDVTPTSTTRPDLPFYDDDPIAVGDRQWLAILAALAVAAGIDLNLVIPGPAWLGMAVRGALFAGIPLATYVVAVPDHWRTIFARLRRTDVRTMLLVLVTNLVVTATIGAAVSQLTSTHANPAAGELASMSVADRLAFFASMVPQLFGEELFTILLLLATMTLATRHLHLPRSGALLAGVAVSTVAFAALHLQTYDWNVLQCLAGIGTARLVLLVAYLRTKNIATSTGAHVLNDWTLFAIALIPH